MTDTMTAVEATNRAIAQQALPVWKGFRTEAENAMQVTTDCLMHILEENKDTAFGKKYDFANIHSIEEYQKKVPVSVYDDFSPYIEKMVKGEPDQLLAGVVESFNTTSGTSGIHKLIPFPEAQAHICMKYNFLHLFGLMYDKLGTSWMKGRAMCTAEGHVDENEDGSKVGGASARMADAANGGENAILPQMNLLYTSPSEALFPGKENDTKYLHCRFALMDKEMTGIVTAFYSSVTLLLRYIEDNWQMLVDDIEYGTINDEVTLSDAYRASLAKKIVPMPERAAELRAIFSQGFDAPMIPKVWPNIQYIQGVGGDGFSVFDKIIKERYSGGCLHNLYAGISASEGIWSVPFDMEHTDSAIAPGSAFIEFLPVEAGSDFTQCVTLDKVEVGRIYELVITSLCGLYRYRMSDAVKITGFYGKTPTVEFMYRVNKTVNLVEEKTTEDALTNSVIKMSERVGVSVIDYTLLPCVDKQKPQYVFYMETMKRPTDDQLTAMRDVLEEELCKANPEYQVVLDEHDLFPLEINILQPQTYLLYRDVMVMKGTTASQLKPVHVIGNPFQQKFFHKLIQKGLTASK